MSATSTSWGTVPSGSFHLLRAEKYAGADDEHLCWPFAHLRYSNPSVARVRSQAPPVSNLYHAESSFHCLSGHTCAHVSPLAGRAVPVSSRLCVPDAFQLLAFAS